jgi:hypothetical protein
VPIFLSIARKGNLHRRPQRSRRVTIAENHPTTVPIETGLQAPFTS